jgi:hypothetical protein
MHLPLRNHSDVGAYGAAIRSKHMKERLALDAEKLGFTQPEIAELIRVYVTALSKAPGTARALAVENALPAVPGGLAEVRLTRPDLHDRSK